VQIESNVSIDLCAGADFFAIADASDRKRHLL
jgi:hypothetical protein